jgi:MFS family permease
LGVVGLALGVTWLWTAQASGITTFFVLRCVGAVFMAGGMTLSYASVARRVRPERKTLAFSLVQSGMQLGMALGPVVGDFVVAGGGIPGLYRLGGTLLIAAGIGMLLLRAIGARLGATTYPG